MRNALETFKPFFPETVDSQRGREGSQSRVAHPVIPGLGGRKGGLEGSLDYSKTMSQRGVRDMAKQLGTSAAFAEDPT